MALFAFEAIDRTGIVVRGRIEARARAAAVEQLLSSGQTPISLTESEGPSWRVRSLLALLGPRQSDFLLIVRELSSLLGAGLPVERALAIMKGATASRATALKIEQMLERLRAGEPLSRALRFAIPANALHIEHLIAAGEASGHLAPVMASLRRNLERSKALRDRIVSALTYPAFLLLTLFAVLWIVFESVLPRLAPTFAEARTELPLPTYILLRISEFVQSYGLLLLLLVAIAGLASSAALRRENVRLAIDRFLIRSRIFLRVPLEYEAAQFCRNLETLLSGGLSLDRALGAARAASGNRWFRSRIAQVQSVVETGVSLRSAFDQSRVLPSLLVEFAAVGEETGNLAAMMGEGADVLEKDVELRLDRLVALVLPLATLFMGLVVAGIMAAIVTGLLAVNDLAM